MSRFKNIYTKRTSKDIWNEHPDKTSYEWLNSAIHSYKVLKREEDKNKLKKKKKGKIVNGFARETHICSECGERIKVGSKVKKQGYLYYNFDCLT